MTPGIFSYHGDRYVAPANRALIIAHFGQSNCGDSTPIAGAPGYLTGGPIAGVYIADKLKAGFAPLEIGENNNVETSHTTYGPEGELGYRLQAELGEDIYILKLNKSGSALDENRQPPTGVESWQYDVEGLCAEALDMIDWAFAQDFGGKIPWFGGILWQQAEADAGANPETPNYRDRWYQTIDTLRARMRRMDLPVALAGISPTAYSATRTYAVLQEIAASDSRVDYLDPAIWAYKVDNVHLDNAGIAACGLAAATALAARIPRAVATPPAPSSAIEALANLVRHIDFSNAASRWQDTAGTTPASAATDPIARIDDLSGNGAHYTQDVSSFEPTVLIAAQNGLDCANFASGDHLFSPTVMPATTTQFAAWYVFRLNSDIGTFMTLEQVGSTDSWDGGFGAVNPDAAPIDFFRVWVNDWMTNFVDIPYASLSSFCLLTLVANGTTFEAFVNGVSVGSVAFSGTITRTAMTDILGAYDLTPAGYLEADVAENVTSIGGESGVDIAAVNAELITKWGL